jgi:hydroxyacyl-ACP dehydratase HTD2-like protein with hotdog domain
MLFRYSALTFNGHRIHYDLPYVTKTEGYPGLVMNGGLTTLLVFELARAHGPAPVRYIVSRNVRALFVNRPITLGGEPSADGKKAKLWAADYEGALALTAEAEFR